MARICLYLAMLLADLSPRSNDITYYIFVPTEVVQCDPSYPNDCIPSPPPDLNCPDLWPLVNIVTLPPDPHKIDRDEDGIGCEYGN